MTGQLVTGQLADNSKFGLVSCIHVLWDSWKQVGGMESALLLFGFIKGHLSSTEPKGHVSCRLLSSTPLSSVTPGLCAVPSTAHLSEGPAGRWHHHLIIYCVPRVPGSLFLCGARSR